jgi:hypothetical protein
MASKAKQPAGPPMTLGNMRELGVQRLVASCLNDACRHVALIDVSKPAMGPNRRAQKRQRAAARAAEAAKRADAQHKALADAQKIVAIWGRPLGRVSHAARARGR